MDGVLVDGKVMKFFVICQYVICKTRNKEKNLVKQDTYVTDECKKTLSILFFRLEKR